MSYTTNAKLKARFENDEAVAALTDTLEETGAPDEAVLTEVREDADGIVDSYLAVRYQVPITTTGHTVLENRLDSLTLDIAANNLLERGDQVSEAKQRRHDRAIAYLEKVSEGKLDLPVGATLASTDSRDPLIAYGGPGTSSDSKRIFTRDTTEGL